MTERQIAKDEGVDQKSVHESITAGIAKLKMSKQLKLLLKMSSFE